MSDKEQKELDSNFEKSNLRFHEAASAINNMVDNSIVTISESVFTGRLLPIMKEWILDKRGDNLHLWAIAAGGPERPIRVSLGSGDYFIVPPPYNHPSTLSAKHQRENNQIHAISELMTRRQADGETREVMRLGNQMVSLLSTEHDTASLARYTILLAKIWHRYNLPVEQVLAELNVDLSLYDREGYYIDNTASTHQSSEGGEEYGDDELAF